MNGNFLFNPFANICLSNIDWKKGKKGFNLEAIVGKKYQNFISQSFM
jgi:hypothetical protein